MVYLFLADGVEEIEALCPLDLMRRAGIMVTTVSIKAEKAIYGSNGIQIEADTTIEELSEQEPLEMVILPGGLKGVQNLDASPNVHWWIEKATKEDAYLAAICAAPMILGKKGLLQGKTAICYPGLESHLKGATLATEKVVQDGKIITAKGMGVAQEFGFALITALKGADSAKKVKEAIMA